MSNWVKITKAKQLRYKLISVMYLIFIALSIINIPIEWLHVNKFMAPLLTETTIVSIENEDLNAVYESVEQTKRDFYVALGFDEVTGTYREPFGYSVTDAFSSLKVAEKGSSNPYSLCMNIRTGWALNNVRSSMNCLQKT